MGWFTQYMAMTHGEFISLVLIALCEGVLFSMLFFILWYKKRRSHIDE